MAPHFSDDFRLDRGGSGRSSSALEPLETCAWPTGTPDNERHPASTAQPSHAVTLRTSDLLDPSCLAPAPESSPAGTIVHAATGACSKYRTRRIAHSSACNRHP